MTDQELIQLVGETAPGELSAGQLAEIHARLPHCDELRQALCEQLAVEERITAALGRIEIDSGRLWSRVAAAERSRRRWNSIAAWAACALIGCVLAIGLTAIPRGNKPQGDLADGGPDRVVSTPPLEDFAQNQALEDDSPGATANDEVEPSDVPVDQDEAPLPEVAAIVEPASTTTLWPELDAQAEPLPLSVTAFRESASASSGISQSQLTRWLAPAVGHAANFFEATRGETPVAGFDGLARLTAPWPADAVLRLAPFEHNGLALHFWNELQGISLYYYESPRPVWAAYRTTRAAGQPRPASWVLIGADNDRYDRSLRGVVEIRHQQGELILSRGDLRLVTVPLSAPPAEVFFDRRAWFRTLGMYRGEPLPDETVENGRELLPDVAPTELPWTSTLAGGTSLAYEEDGTLRLSREKDAGPAWAGLALPRTGLWEAIVQLDGAEPGTGVFLGDESGKPQFVLGALKEHRTGGTTLQLMRAESAGFETHLDVANQPVAFFGAGQWIRIVAGCGAVKVWTSGDGRHWGRAFDPLRGARDDCSSLGLMAIRAGVPGRIGLKRLQLRELSGITARADADLLENVPRALLAPEGGLAAWQAQVLASQPPDVGVAAWRVACTVRLLSEGRSAGMGNRLLAGLMDDFLDSARPLPEQLRVLDQALLVADAWELPDADRFLHLYDRAVRQAFDRSQVRAFSETLPSLLAGPLWCSGRFQVCPEPLVRAELTGLVYEGRWPDVLELCRRLQFWNRASQPDHSWPDHRQRTKRLTEWAEAQARSVVADRDVAAPNAPQTIIRWQHPLVAPSGREGWSVLADLQSALEESQFVEAGQILQSIGPGQLQGLLPSEGEPGLYESLLQFVADSLVRHPGWRETMVERFGNRGGLMYQQAARRGTVRDMESMAVQFAGTPAAALAYRWLGDRALAEGNFLGALAEYDRGRKSTPVGGAGAGEFAARERLAAAFLGRDLPAVDPAAVPAIEPALTAAEFEGLVIQVRSGATPLETGSAVRPRRRRGKIEPLAWRAQQFGEWQGQTGGPNGEPPESGDVDWAARQISLVSAGDRLLVSNRLQMLCFNLKTGQREWQQVFPESGQFLQRWPLLSLQAAAAGDRVYLRRPNRELLSACCLEAASGRELWVTDPGLYVCSDPLLIQGMLYCFTTSTPPLEQTWQMELTALDPETGAVVRSRPVTQFNNLTDRFLSAQVTLAGARLIAAIGGSVVSCDFNGRVLWIRRQTWIPAAVDPSAGDRDFSRPLVVGQRVLVTQPGVLDLECLDLETGRRLWRAPFSDGRRIVGSDDRRAYVETSRGISAIALEDGRIAWRHAVSGLLDASWSDGEGGLLYARTESLAPDKARPLLVWLETDSGRVHSVWPLIELEDPQPVLGPLLRRGDQMWTLFGRGLRGGPRGLCQLTSIPEPAFAAHDDPDGVDRWTFGVSDSRTRLLAERFLPEWSQFGGVADANVGFRPEFQGQHEVLATLAAPDRPLVFSREVSLAAGSGARLLLRVGHDAADKWKIRVRAAGRVLLAEPVDAGSVDRNWGRFEVDLSEFAGQSIRLVVEQIAVDRPAWGYWKQLEIVL